MAHWNIRAVSCLLDPSKLQLLSVRSTHFTSGGIILSDHTLQFMVGPDASNVIMMS